MLDRTHVDDAVAALAPEILALAEAIRCDPELSGHEVRASTRCAALLRAHGFEVETGTGGLPTALLARRRFGSSGTKVAFLAEYDALPGIGHGCGHHLIAASSVGAALTVTQLAGQSDNLEIQLIGTPSEETIGGKVVMAEAGVFDGLDAALMFHAGHEWRTVTDSLACQSVEVLFGGRTAHAVASPEAGLNALDAMIDLFVAVREMKTRFSPAVRIPGVILEGGLRANIVPDRAVARFSARAPTTEERDALVEALLQLVTATARARGCRSLVRPVDNPYDEMRTNRALAETVAEELRKRGAVPNEAPRKGKGSIDAGNVSRRTAAIHGYLPAAPLGIPLHSREFGDAATATATSDALLTACAALAASAMRVSRDPLLKARVRAEFEASPRPPITRRWPLLTDEPEERVEC